MHFKDKSLEEKDDLVRKIGALLKEHGLEDTKVTTATELVCNVTAATVEENTSVSVKKSVQLADAEKAKNFMAAVAPVVEGIKGVEVSVTAQIGAQDPYQTITGIVPIKGDAAPIDLVHKEGEVWLVDFWATWCPPCQAPMAHNQSMLEKNAEAWGGKVRIIGISIDQGKEAVASHVEAKGWNAVEHYHRAGSDCSKVYSVSGVPHVMLVDTQGKIVFKGHPANRQDLEADFATLLKGEAITGAGTEAAGAPAGGADNAGFKEMDLAAVSAEVAEIKTVFEGFTKDEGVKKTAEGMPRGFCVIVLQQEYSPVDEKTKMKYENYRVLVGKQEKIDSLKATFDEKVKGSFEVQLREQAV